MYYLILTIIILMALITIFVVFWRKRSEIKEDVIVETSKDKQMKVKNKLIEKRLEKRILEGSLFVVNKIKSFFEMILVGFKRTRKKIFKIISQYKSINWKQKTKKRIYPNDDNLIDSLILEAQTLLKKRKIDAAEDKFIKVLEKDSKNIKAYMGLGEIYVIRKDLATAEEAYRYIIKINNKFLDGYKELFRVFELTKKWDELKNIANEVLELGHEEAWVYGMLAKSYKKRGYPEEAEKYFKQAVEIEPQNEKWLNLLIETAILNKDKVIARKAFNTLSQICRDEIKLQGYRDKMDLL